jgi:hypothetical protein
MTMDKQDRNFFVSFSCHREDRAVLVTGTHSALFLLCRDCLQLQSPE